MASKYKTVVFDSAGELARLYFSKDMGKTAEMMDTIRAVGNYPGSTERLNMLVRRCKDLRKAGTEVVFLAHEDIQKVYARGGMIAAKGQTPQEPIAVSGQPDLPGNKTPADFCRAADNVFHHVTRAGKAQWIGRREPLSSGNDYWEVKDRFNAPAVNAGLLPASYGELARLAAANPACNWSPPYIWMLYGAFGTGKTRSLLTFPQPMCIFDLDAGSKSIEKEIKASNGAITLINNINPEHGPDYEVFMKQFAALF